MKTDIIVLHEFEKELINMSMTSVTFRMDSTLKRKITNESRSVAMTSG